MLAGQTGHARSAALEPIAWAGYEGSSAISSFHIKVISMLTSKPTSMPTTTANTRLAEEHTHIRDHYVALQPGQSARVRLGQRYYTVARTDTGPQVHRCMPRSLLAGAWTATVDLLSTRSLSTRAGLYESDLVQRQQAFDQQHTELFAALAAAERPPLPVAGSLPACVSKQQVQAMKAMMHALDRLAVAMPTPANEARLERLRERLHAVATQSADARAAIERGQQTARTQLAISQLAEEIQQKLQDVEVPLINRKAPQLSRFEWPEQDRQDVLAAMTHLTVLVGQRPSSANQQLLADLQEQIAPLIALIQQ